MPSPGVHAASLSLLALLTRCVPAAAPPPAPATATNWANPALGATATASSAGYWAGYTAEPQFALEDDLTSFWSSTGGTVCCTESNPAWLLVSLGALRPVAAFQVVHFQDMSFTIALANASAGPFVTVASQFCEVCTMNYEIITDMVGHHFRTYTVPGGPLAALFVRLRITYSTFGGIGGCSDLCDWATDVHRFAVFGPGALPAFVRPAPPPPVGGTIACADEFQILSPQVDGMLLVDGAVLQPPGSGPNGAASVQLTPAEPLHSGAVEFTRVVRPDETCGTCSEPHQLIAKLHVWLGASRTLPGEGLVVSMVDATRQTPGATRYVQGGCGVQLALPLHAVSIVFDTGDNDASCENQQHGTGMRLVSTLDPSAPPVVLQSTLEMGTSAFRTGHWVSLYFNIHKQELGNGVVANTSVAQDRPWVPIHIFVNGDELLSTRSTVVGSLEAFYFVVSARTSENAADQHAVSSLALDCRLLALNYDPENFAGYRQPFAPPPFLPPPPPWSAPPPSQQVSAPASSGAISFVLAFSITATLLVAAAVGAHRRRRRTDDGATADSTALLPRDDAVKPAHSVAVDVAAEHGLDVFISYRRLDHRLADAVHDKLRLCGLRVFKDVDGRMAGAPFGTEMIRAVRAAPVFAPLVTVPCLQRMAAAAGPDAEVDFTLAEWLAALHFRATGHVRLVHPLLSGLPPPAAEDAGQKPPVLTEDPQYVHALAALPDAVPVATARAVNAALRAANLAPLSPEEAAWSVRDIVCGAAGVLSGNVFAVDYLPDDLGLYISSRYAPPILRVLADKGVRARRLSVELADTA